MRISGAPALDRLSIFRTSIKKNLPPSCLRNWDQTEANGVVYYRLPDVLTCRCSLKFFVLILALWGVKGSISIYRSPGRAMVDKNPVEHHPTTPLSLTSTLTRKKRFCVALESFGIHRSCILFPASSRDRPVRFRTRDFIRNLSHPKRRRSDP
jgi:hypothetical protein